MGQRQGTKSLQSGQRELAPGASTLRTSSGALFVRKKKGAYQHLDNVLGEGRATMTETYGVYKVSYIKSRGIGAGIPHLPHEPDIFNFPAGRTEVFRDIRTTLVTATA